MPKVLRPGDEYYLISELIEKVSEEKLPSKKEVLSRFIFSRSIGQKAVAESLKECAIEVENIWASANIPTQNHYRVQKKIKLLYSEWVGLKKNRPRKSDTQRQNEDKFSRILETLFDISYNDSIQKINSDDKKLLGIDENVIQVSEKLIERKDYWLGLAEVQRSDFVEVEVDTSTNNQSDEIDGINSTNEPLQQQISDINYQPEREDDVNCDTESDLESDTESELEFCIANMSLAAAEIDFESDSDSDDDYLPPNKYKKKASRKKKVIMSPSLSAALDRSNITDREAVYILAAAATSMGLSPENMVINRESFRQSRRTNRQAKSVDIQESFNPNTPLVLHWDGKLLKNVNLNKKVDRIAVIVTGNGMSQTLGVPYITKSTGQKQAELVYNTVKKWKNVLDKIQFMAFDTTSLNTGRLEGTCVWLQKLIGKRLLWLACRHHIMELIVSIVYKTTLRDISRSPNIRLFERFRSYWNNIVKTEYESCLQDQEVFEHMLSVKDEIISFVNDQLENFPTNRDDYKLLILTLLFLGEKAPDYKIGEVNTYVIHTCGALHRARWMAKLIYSFKIYLFRSQFGLSDMELSGLKQFLMFVVRVYIKNWYQAPCTLTAAQNDLRLFKDIAQYKAINPEISDVAMEKFSRHTWYLSEELSGIAFFDTSLDNSEKVAMVKALQKPGCMNPAVRPKMNVNLVKDCRLSDFITSNSLAIFRAMNISDEFLKSDPQTWCDRKDYIEAQNLVKNLKVVNDVAERGVALATTFNGHITKDEDQWQFLLQCVENQRKMMPNANKKTVLKGMK